MIEEGNDTEDLSRCMWFSTLAVRSVINAHLLPLYFLSETPLFNRIVTPRATQALKTALDELGKCQDNIDKVLQEIAANKDAQNQPTE